jgi:uncharacterized protein YndB with AHSA1/START domain
MAIKTISKVIEISAPAETVWHVLFDDAMYRQWSGVFSPGSFAISDWQTGSQVQFIDKQNTGLFAKIHEANPPHLMSLVFLGTIENGQPDTESQEAKEFKDAKEVYRLNEANGITRLEIAADMTEKYYNNMSEAWDKALIKVKRLAESN